MSDITSHVGATISAEEVEQLQSRAATLGWQLRTRPAGSGQVRVTAITAPAAPEDEPTQGINEEFSSPFQIAPATSSGQSRRDRVLVADHNQPALAIAD